MPAIAGVLAGIAALAVVGGALFPIVDAPRSAPASQPASASISQEERTPIEALANDSKPFNEAEAAVAFTANSTLSSQDAAEQRNGRVLGAQTTNLAPFLSQLATFLRSFDAYVAAAPAGAAYPRYGGYVPSTGGSMIGTVPANTALAAPVITGGSITNASSGSFDALSAGTLSVSGAATFGTVTIASTNASSSNITDLTSTNATTTNLAISSLSHSLLAADQTGRVIATSTISWNLIRGTANSIFAFDASGNPIATTTIGSGYITGTLGTINGTTFNRGDALAITAASSTLLANNNTFSGSNIFSQPLSLTSTTGTTTIATGQGFTIGTSQFVLQQSSGNVGIGTTSPAAKLDMDATGTAFASNYGLRSFMIGGPNSTNYAGYFHASGASTNYGLYVAAGNAYINGSLDMNNNTINNVGNMQIGATPHSSWGNLVVRDTTTGHSAGQGGQLVFCGDDRDQGACWATFAMIKGIKENSNYLDALGAITFSVRDNATEGTALSGLNEKMRITSGGNVGIGTTAPATKLDVYGGGISTTHSTSYSWSMNNSEANASNWQISNITGTGGAGGLRFYNGTNAAEYLRITNAGTTVVKGGLSMSGNSPVNAIFDGCGCSTLMWQNVAATAGSSTAPEIGAQFNMNSNIGLANATSAYKIGLTSSVDGGANSARIYAFNTIARGYAGDGGYLVTGIESDVDNNGADATTLAASTAAYGMVSVAGGGPGKSTAGYWATAVNDGSWTYGFASSGTINTSAFYDASNAQSILSAVGSHTNGIDISGATISGNEFHSPSFLVKGNGKVGINTTNITGNLTVSAGTDRMLNFRGDPASFGTSQAGIILQGVNSAQNASTPITLTGSALYLNPNGANIGIGTTSPTAQLHTTGTVRFSNFGAGTLTTDASGNLSVSSDERLKNLDGQFTRGLADVIKLNPINYHWNATSGLDPSTQYAGFSAQNVQQAIPEAVGSSTNGYLTLQDRPLIAAAINAIKELSAKLDTLHAAVSGFAERFSTGELFARKARIDELCVGSVCVSEQQFLAMAAAGGSYTITTSNQPAPPLPAPTNDNTATTTPTSAEQPATSTPSTDIGTPPPQSGDAPPSENNDPFTPPAPSNDNPPPIDSADEGGTAPTQQQDAA